MNINVISICHSIVHALSHPLPFFFTIYIIKLVETYIEINLLSSENLW